MHVGGAMPKEEILIVDDEPAILRLTMGALSKAGYIVKSASSGHDALGMLKGENLDLLLVDVVMPDMDGLELLRRAREVAPDITAVIMTGYGTADIAVASLKAGAQSFLAKPFGIEELKATIREALERSRLTKENARLKALMPLFDMTKALVLEVEPDKLFNLIVQTAALETGADRAYLMLLDEATQELAIKAAVGLSQETAIATREKIGEGIAGRVAKTGKSLILGEGARVSPRLKEAMKQAGVISVLCVPLKVKDRVIGVLNSSKVIGESPFTQGDLEVLSILAGQATSAVENAYLFQSVKDQRIRLGQLLTQLLNAQESERRRLSAEIHDSVAQWMIGASHLVQTCGVLLSQSKSKLDEASGEIDHISSTIDQSIHELRRIMADLHPLALSELGLEGALRQNAQALQRETGITCHFQTEGVPRRLSPSQEIRIYRIVQEALNNVRKHARATEVNIRLQFRPNDVLAEIRDNGKGFDLSRATESRTPSGGMGLLNMKERAELLGGSLKIETGPEAGTRVILTVPINLNTGKEE
jgi:signal transduction histidine kinase